MTGPEVELPKLNRAQRIFKALSPGSKPCSEVHQVTNHILRGWDEQNKTWIQPVWPSLGLQGDDGKVKVIFKSDVEKYA